MSVYIWAATKNDYSAMRGPCPEGFHVPSKDEWVALCWILTSTFWLASNTTTMGTYLKMPSAGLRNRSSSGVAGQGSNGYYWAYTAYSSGRTYYLYITSSSINPQEGGYRGSGFSVRCFKDAPVIPDSNWTTLYQGTWSAWVFRNSSLWLISVSWDWTTWYTIQDKNLGATTVYNQWDTLSDANCGYFYQWGNNYWFAHSWTITTSSTQVDASNYWPWNYYNSSTFITTSSSPYDWSNVQNDDLWWWETWVKQIPKELKSAYIGEYDPYTTFTISWTEQSNMSSGWTYSDWAAWLTAGSTAFDEFFWYSAVRLSAAGVETAEVTQTTPWTLDLSQLWTLTSWDNVMIKFPRRGIKMTKDWSTITLSITNNPHAEAKGFQYYAHSRWTFDSPVSKDYMYLWAFKGYSLDNILKSWSGKGPSVSMDQWSCISHARANDWNDWSAWYDIIWFYQRQYINALYMMKYWNPDSQSVVWAWYTWWTSTRNTWWTVSQTAATYWTSSGTQQVKLFWLEDRRWNVREWVWWMCTDWSKNLYTALSGFVPEIKTASPYANTWTKIQHSSWNCIIAVAWNNEAMFWPTTTAGNTSFNTYYCDYAGVWASNLASAWDYFNRWAYSGAFNIYVWHSTSASSSYVGSRLMYL